MGATYGTEQDIIIRDRWSANGNEYALINYGFGPDKLCRHIDNEWVEERECYRWGLLCQRIDKSDTERMQLRARVKELEEALDKGIDGAMDEDLMPNV